MSLQRSRCRVGAAGRPVLAVHSEVDVELDCSRACVCLLYAPSKKQMLYMVFMCLLRIDVLPTRSTCVGCHRRSETFSDFDTVTSVMFIFAYDITWP
jgi:hypothetical protein